MCVCARTCTYTYAPVQFSELFGSLYLACKISQCCGGVCAEYGVSELFRSLFSGLRAHNPQMRTLMCLSICAQGGNTFEPMF